MRPRSSTHRDLSGGGLFLAFISLLALLVSCLLPVWFFTTIELQGRMCSCGTGLWQANFTWGDDLTEPNAYEPLSCTADNPAATVRCDASWERADRARRMGRQAGALSVMAIACLMAATVCGWRHVPGFGDPVYAKRAYLCCVAGFAFQCAAMGWFTSSPVFEELSYYFGCHFEFVHAVNSNSLVCHALGPGWALSALALIFCFVAAVLFFFAYNPTAYTHPSTGRYSLFTEMFERHETAARGDMETRLLMAADEVAPPVDNSSAPRRFFRAYGIPLMCIANLSLFLYSNLSTGATVEPHIRLEFPDWLAVVIKASGLPLKNNVLEFRDDVFNFTLVSSLRHFWSSKAYALAFLIGAFSGIWPYAKVFGMLMLWFVPASERLRGRALHWIDLLGKWSLIDSFFLCLMAVGFGFDTSVKILGINIAVSIEVRPGWGVYSFVVATIWSLILSHYLTHLHRLAVERRTWTQSFLKSMNEPPHESLGTRPFAPLISSKSDSGQREVHRRFKCRSFGRGFMWVLLFITFCVTFAGQLAKSFEFTFGGLAELILSPEKRVTEYSLVSIGEAIPYAARHGGYFAGNGWNWFLMFQFFFLAMIVPLIRLILLTVLWSVPMTLRTAEQLHHFGEIVAAWSAMDVFLVAIMAAVFEIGQLSTEVISSAFGPLEADVCMVLTSLPPPLLNSVLHLVGLPSIDLSKGCALFRVDAEMSGGCWILLVAILASECSAHIIMELCEASISERKSMLSAYHRAKNPLISPRLRLVANQISPTQSAVAGANSAGLSSRQIRRLLSAQEIGSKNFVGSWFDSFYGPFPRKWWYALVDLKFMKRVGWDEIGQDLRADLVEVSDTESDNDGAARGHTHATRAVSAASMASSNILIARSDSQQLLEDLLSVNESDASWVSSSPVVKPNLGQR